MVKNGRCANEKETFTREDWGSQDLGALGKRSQCLRMVLRQSRKLLRVRRGRDSDLEWKRDLLQERGPCRLPERTQLYLECTQATSETLQI